MTMKERDRAKFEARQAEKKEAEKANRKTFKRRMNRERGLNAVAFWAYEHDRDDNRDISPEC